MDGTRSVSALSVTEQNRTEQYRTEQKRTEPSNRRDRILIATDDRQVTSGHQLIKKEHLKNGEENLKKLGLKNRSVY